MKKEYSYMADMGSIKIMTNESSHFFSNNYGDGIFRVFVCEEKDIPKEADFKGHFTVLKKAWLMRSDCDNEGRQHEFTPARYFVMLDKDGTTFYIYEVDKELHS